jgi:hypothetical protein
MRLAAGAHVVLCMDFEKADAMAAVQDVGRMLKLQSNARAS